MKKYEDAAKEARTHNLWNLIIALKREGREREERAYDWLRIKDYFTELAQSPGANAPSITSTAWSKLDDELEAIARVLFCSIHDWYYIPPKEVDGRKEWGQAQQDAERLTRLLQANKAIELLTTLPIGTNDLSQGLYRDGIACLKVPGPLYQKTRKFLLLHVANFWYEVNSEETADNLFTALIENMQGPYRDLAIAAMKDFDSYPDIGRIRKALLRLLDPKLPGNRSLERYSQTLAAVWLGKLTQSQVALHARLDEILGADVSQAAVDKLEGETKRIKRIDEAAQAFTKAMEYHIGRDWLILKIDSEKTVAHVQLHCKSHRLERRQWHEITASWQRDIERFQPTDPGVQIHIEITGWARDEQQEKYFSYTITPKAKVA